MKREIIMKRDYSKFVDDAYNDKTVEPFDILMKREIRKTIEEDTIDDALENIMALIYETRYEW